MTQAISIRFPPELVRRAKDRAHESGMTFTAFVSGAIEARLAASIIDSPMKPVLAPRETCAHPFRDEFGACKVCGEQR